MFTFITKCLTVACSRKISKIMFFLFFLFATIQLKAQDYDASDLDSLKKAAYKSTEKNKIDCYNHISLIYFYNNFDSSFYYGNSALKIAEKINYEQGIAVAHDRIATVYYYLRDNNNSLRHLIKALELYKKLGYKKDVLTTMQNLITLYTKMSLYDKALDNGFKCLKASEEIKDTSNITAVYRSTALIYGKMGMREKAIELNLKALKLYRGINDEKPIFVDVMNNIGSFYVELDKLDSAKHYIKKALTLSKSVNLKAFADVCETYGRLFFEEHKYDSALIYHYKAIAINTKLKINDVHPFISLSKAYLKLNKMDSSKYYLDKAHKMMIKVNDLETNKSIYRLYAKYYEKINDTPKALEYYRLYSATKDTILSEISRNKVIDLQIGFETEKLKAENEIQTLKITQNRNQRNFSILLSALILILTIVIYNRFLLKKKINRLLTEKNIELENINKIKDKFFGIVAHDLKNQLQAFQNILQVLTEDYDQISEEKRHKLIIRINSAANTLYGVLENLLIWSTSQIKGINFEPKEINLNELSNQVLNELKLTAERKTVSLRNKIPLDISVLADENMVRNIIRNLVNNSIKFSDENTEVTITSIKKDDKIEVSIIDQGIGISDIDKEKLFRLDVDHKQIGSQKEKGTGLGLVISKTFIEKMKGNIWISNNVERGCIFSFSLPIYSR